MISTTGRRIGRPDRRATTTSGSRRAGALAAVAGVAALAWSSPQRTHRDVSREASRVTRADGGRIEGTVVISRAIATRRPAFRIYSDLGPGAQPPKEAAPDSIGELRNVVIYLEPDPAVGRAPAAANPAPHDSMVQRNEQFVPHVLPVLVGSVVSFPNDDDVYHNVFSISAAKTFEIPRIPKAAPASMTSRTFDKPGIVQVFCHIHSDMSGIIFVMDNPYYATPQPTGHYTIDGIPPGSYTLTAWHERIKAIVRHVQIAAGANPLQDFNIPLPAGARGK